MVGQRELTYPRDVWYALHQWLLAQDGETTIAARETIRLVLEAHENISITLPDAMADAVEWWVEASQSDLE